MFNCESLGSLAIPDSDESIDSSDIHDLLEDLESISGSIDYLNLSQNSEFGEGLERGKEEDNEASSRLKIKYNSNSGEAAESTGFPNSSDEDTAEGSGGPGLKILRKDLLKKCVASAKSLICMKDLVKNCVSAKVKKAMAKAWLTCVVQFRGPHGCAVHMAIAMAKNADFTQLKAPQCKNYANVWKHLVNQMVGICQTILKPF